MTALIIVAVLAYLLGWASAASFSLSNDDEPVDYYPTDEWNGMLP